MICNCDDFAFINRFSSLFPGSAEKSYITRAYWKEREKEEVTNVNVTVKKKKEPSIPPHFVNNMS